MGHALPVVYETVKGQRSAANQANVTVSTRKCDHTNLAYTGRTRKRAYLSRWNVGKSKTACSVLKKASSVLKKPIL